MAHESGLLEISAGEPKDTLIGLLKAAGKEEKILLTEVRNAVTCSRRARDLVKPYKADIFGESFGIKGRFAHKKFKRLIKESLQLAISAKVHLPAIEIVAKEVKDWLLKHKTDTEILPADEKIIAEVRKAEELLAVAIKGLTELDLTTWGTASHATWFFLSTYYVPVEHQSEHEVGLKFRADWIKPLKHTTDSLEQFAKAVEDIFKLQEEINKNYRV